MFFLSKNFCSSPSDDGSGWGQIYRLCGHSWTSSSFVHFSNYQRSRRYFLKTRLGTLQWIECSFWQRPKSLCIRMNKHPSPFGAFTENFLLPQRLWTWYFCRQVLERQLDETSWQWPLSKCPEMTDCIGTSTAWLHSIMWEIWKFIHSWKVEFLAYWGKQMYVYLWLRYMT